MALTKVAKLYKINIIVIIPIKDTSYFLKVVFKKKI